MTLQKNKLRLISATILIALTIFLGYRFYYIFVTASACDQDFLLEKKDRYNWLFDDKKIDRLICKYPLGNPTAGKYRFLYILNNKYRYWIIEDSKLNNVAIDKIKDTSLEVSSNRPYIDPSEVNDMGWGGHIFFRSKLCIDSSNNLLLKYGRDAKVTRKQTAHSILFTGQFKNILIQNEKEDNQYLIKYDESTPTTILFYKPKDILYLIVVNSFHGQKVNDTGIDNLNIY